MFVISQHMEGRPPTQFPSFPSRDEDDQITGDNVVTSSEEPTNSTEEEPPPPYHTLNLIPSEQSLPLLNTPQPNPAPQPEFQPQQPRQQQQQQQSNTVVFENNSFQPTNPNQPNQEFVSFAGPVILSCLTAWFFGIIFGVIAFVLAGEMHTL